MYILCSTSGFKRLFLIRILRLRSFGEGRGRPDSICEGSNRKMFLVVLLETKSCLSIKGSSYWIVLQGMLEE